VVNSNNSHGHSLRAYLASKMTLARISEKGQSKKGRRVLQVLRPHQLFTCK
jgi:hypothetical protein